MRFWLHFWISVKCVFVLICWHWKDKNQPKIEASFPIVHERWIIKKESNDLLLLKSRENFPFHRLCLQFFRLWDLFSRFPWWLFNICHIYSDDRLSDSRHRGCGQPFRMLHSSKGITLKKRENMSNFEKKRSWIFCWIKRQTTFCFFLFLSQ